jgi:hypothetical protein
MPNIRSEGCGEIKVADVTIAQLSRGLYRSTATAFKELVSNAYDADATEVRIDTNFPEFNFISCLDNGIGMSLEQFLNYFSKNGIGSCTKRRDQRDRTERFKRPIIGRLGIGMLAIGQLSHSFKIESHYTDEKTGEGKAYQAEIVLLDESIPDREEVIKSGSDDIDVGKWQYKIIDYEKRKRGFRIYTSDVRKTFTDEMKSEITDKNQDRMSFRLNKLHAEFYDTSKKSIRELGPYLETIWELAILCPLPYYGSKEKFPLDIKAFKKNERRTLQFKKAINIVNERQHGLLEEQFRVVFDGIDLRRHIQLPTNQEVIPKLYPLEFCDEVMRKRLKFSGYLFAQVAHHIKPAELNGIQIRLRNVGIAGYDSTFLKYYKQVETIRSKWVSGEIFVDEGLESALNIDRDSFNEHDEHFKKLQKLLHDELDKVFEEISRLAKEESESRRDERVENLSNSMQDAISARSKGRFKLHKRSMGRNKPPVIVDPVKGEIILNIEYQFTKKKKANSVIQAIEIAYHAARAMDGSEEFKHEFFLELVRDIMKAIL